jgi:hypothetical protein
MNSDPQAKKELRRLVGFLAVPTLVVNGELFLGFEVNRRRIEGACGARAQRGGNSQLSKL